MKRALIAIILITVVSLCGCAEKPLEVIDLDYEEMDKEYGQYRAEQDKKKDETDEFAEELPYIEESVTEYVDCLLKGDANRYAATFPKEYILAIMEADECTEEIAFNIAGTKIWEIFNKTENRYIGVKEAMKKNEYSVTITNISRYNLEQTLIKWYAKYDIEITDVIGVDFVVASGDQTAEGQVYIAKTARGNWEPDMRFFDI